MSVKQADPSVVVEASQPRFRLTLRTISFVLVAIGLAISLYLSYVKLTEEPMICAANGAFNCSAVQNSVYAELYGIPIAWLGLAVNLVILGLLVLEPRVAFLRENGVLLLFGIVLFATLYSAYLIYVQGVILNAWCSWCVAHEIYVFALLIVTGLRIRNLLAS